MKQKALVLSGCIAATTPSVSIADVLPDNLIGLNLGEIQAGSFLNQPFKGVIPFLFTSYENTKALEVRLAPDEIFNQIGAERHPVLNSLNFQITSQDDKPVILISSSRPINLPFLNFVLEINGPKGAIYQDYTVLLDPETRQQNLVETEYLDVNPLSKEIIEPTIAVSNRSLKYRVKAGDSLSKIAKKKNYAASWKTVSRLIFQKNPNAFIGGNKNKLKKGVVLTLPTESEVSGFEIARQNRKTVSEKLANNAVEAIDTSVSKESERNNSGTYEVKKGDSLSKITKKFLNKDLSFTKLMNAIYSENPNAFIKNNKNKIKAGVKINIPSVESSIQIAEETDIQEKQYQNSVTKNIIKKEVNTPIAQVSKTPVESHKTEKELKANQYKIKKGDRLANLAIDLGYSSIPFPKMMKAIYTYNPNAFLGGNIAKLKEGAVITIPSLNYVKNGYSHSNKAIRSKKVITQKPVLKTERVSPNFTGPSNRDLVKRIRELRKQLSDAKFNLSALKRNLNNKELLLKQKNIQLDLLNATLIKLNGNIDPDLILASAKKVSDVKPNLFHKASRISTYQPKSKAELANLKQELLERKKQTDEALQKIQTARANFVQSFQPSDKLLDDKSLVAEVTSSLFKSKENTAYTIALLLLGLLLIRYRRQLYSYTYSKISYDHPNYYPAPKIGQYDLKERNISFQGPKIDEDAKDYDLLNNYPKTKTEETKTHQAETEILEKEIEEVSNELKINSILVETSEDFFAINDESKEEVEFKDIMSDLLEQFEQPDHIDK